MTANTIELPVTGKPKISLNLDTSFIKLIAAAAMLLDHMGKIFLPEIIALQIIGRISFPIFAYCSVVGALYTSDIVKYMTRLTILAVVSQFIYIQAFVPGAANLLLYYNYKNVLFTLLIGVLSVYGLKESKPAVFIVSLIIAAFGGLDYGFFGVMLIISFYVLRENSLLSFIIIATQLAYHFFTVSRTIDILGLSVGLRGFGLLGLPFIYVKTNVYPKINKSFFYIFYPLHLLILFIFHIVL